jgi:hypothetical protein
MGAAPGTLRQGRNESLAMWELPVDIRVDTFFYRGGSRSHG